MIRRLADQLDADDREVLIGWVSDPDLTAGSIAAELEDAGLMVAGKLVRRGSVERHRRQDCTCLTDRPDLYV